MTSIGHPAFGRRAAPLARQLRSLIATDEILDFLWLRTGMAFHFAEDYDAAQAAYLHAVEVPATRAMAMYQLACIHALRGEVAPALSWLERSLEAGMGEYQHLVGDSDLDGSAVPWWWRRWPWHSSWCSAPVS